MFVKDKDDSDLTTAIKKTRLIKAVTSSLVSGMLFMKKKGIFGDEEMGKDELETLENLFQSTANIISFGVGRVLGVDNKILSKRVNEENNKPNDDEEQRTDGPIEDDFL